MSIYILSSDQFQVSNSHSIYYKPEYESTDASSNNSNKKWIDSYLWENFHNVLGMFNQFSPSIQSSSENHNDYEINHTNNHKYYC